MEENVGYVDLRFLTNHETCGIVRYVDEIFCCWGHEICVSLKEEGN